MDRGPACATVEVQAQLAYSTVGNARNYQALFFVSPHFKRLHHARRGCRRLQLALRARALAFGLLLLSPPPRGHHIASQLREDVRAHAVVELHGPVDGERSSQSPQTVKATLARNVRPRLQIQRTEMIKNPRVDFKTVHKFRLSRAKLVRVAKTEIECCAPVELALPLVHRRRPEHLRRRRRLRQPFAPTRQPPRHLRRRCVRGGRR